MLPERRRKRMGLAILIQLKADATHLDSTGWPDGEVVA
jgi:hypothetical protein